MTTSKDTAPARITAARRRPVYADEQEARLSTPPLVERLCPCGRALELDLGKQEPFCTGCGRSDACVCHLAWHRRPQPIPGAH